MPPPAAPRAVERSAGPIEIVRVEPDCRALAGAAQPIRVEVTVATDGSVSEARMLSSAPEDAKVDQFKNRLTWGSGRGLVRSTAKEVFDLALARDSGFRVAK